MASQIAGFLEITHCTYSDGFTGHILSFIKTWSQFTLKYEICYVNPSLKVPNSISKWNGICVSNLENCTVTAITGPRRAWIWASYHTSTTTTTVAHYSDVIIGTMAPQITSLTIVYATVYSGADQRKHQSSGSLAFVWGIHRWPVNSLHKWPVTRKMFPFDDVIMYHNSLLVTSTSIISEVIPTHLKDREAVNSISGMRETIFK